MPGPASPLESETPAARTDEDLGRIAIAVLAHELRTADACDDERSGTPLHHLADLFADALECVEALPPHVLGEHPDLDAREVVGDRLAAGRLLARVGAHVLGVERLDCRSLARVEHHPEHVERELPLGAGQLLRLPEQPALELAAPLHHLQIQPPVLVALLLRRSSFCLISTWARSRSSSRRRGFQLAHALSC